MKSILLLACVLLLAACSGMPYESTPRADFPVALTRLGSTVDPKTAQVDVQLSVKNAFPRRLKTLRMFVAVYNASGAQLGSDEVIEVLGPISNGESFGPLEKITAIRDRNAKCVGVTRVEAVMMDYATRVIAGKDARSLVTDSSYRACAAS